MLFFEVKKDTPGHSRKRKPSIPAGPWAWDWFIGPQMNGKVYGLERPQPGRPQVLGAAGEA